MLVIMESILRLGHLTILYDGDCLPNPSPDWFEPEWWKSQACSPDELGGRGQALAIDSAAGPAVLRQYRRGGLVRHIVDADYFYRGLNTTRAFKEWRLTQALAQEELPAPKPLAAAVWRFGLRYRAALMTARIAGEPLTQVANQLGQEHWHQLGCTIKRFAQAGVIHPDLNAGNIIVDEHGGFHLIDFDRARRTKRELNPAAMTARLERSLKKLGLPFDHNALISGTRDGET